MRPLLIIALCCGLTIALAQTQSPSADTVAFAIELQDGSRFIGSIIEQTNGQMKLQTVVGLVTIDMASIKTMTRVEPSSRGNGLYEEYVLQSNKYLLTSNAYGLRKGESYYQNAWIFANQFSYGFTDHFSLTAGLIPLFLFPDGPTPIWASPKFSFPVVDNKVHVGAGALFAGVLGEFGGEGGTILFGQTTFGSRDKNVTFGLGVPLVNGGEVESAAISVAASFKTGSKGYFITENYFAEGSGIISLGGRRMVNKVSIDYGLFVPIIDFGAFIGIPWLGITVPLTKD